VLFTGRASLADTDPRIARLLEAISEERLARSVKALEAFGTRHTLSGTDSPTRGIGAARQWLLDEMRRAGPRLEVTFDTYQVAKQGERIVRDVELRNVMAVLPGRGARRLYVSGHYDSLARPVRRGDTPTATGGFDWSATEGPAPGANDDGSGTALAIELARVFAESGLEFEATLVFIAFAGEEQGLVGATLHARRAAAEKLPIEAVLNSDIVGGSRGGNGRADTGSVRVFSEGPEDSPSRQVARYVRRQAALYVPSHEVRLVARHDRFGRGGDHTAFNQHGFAGVRFTESRENYARQHTVEDTSDGVDTAYLARNARVWRRRWPGSPSPPPRRRSATSAAARCSAVDPAATTPTCAGSPRRARPATVSSGGRPGPRTGRTSGRWATSPRSSSPTSRSTTTSSGWRRWAREGTRARSPPT
jgi:hypothetical protein